MTLTEIITLLAAIWFGTLAALVGWLGFVNRDRHGDEQ
jgi:hypothetical protein